MISMGPTFGAPERVLPEGGPGTSKLSCLSEMRLDERDEMHDMGVYAPPP
jgi:hypothetical protein